jgi:hypothetical protein
MNYVLISRHVVFDELSFPFASPDPPPDDLDSFSSNPAVHIIAPPYPSSVAGTSETVTIPRAALVPLPAPCAVPTPSPMPRAALAPQSVPRVASTSRVGSSVYHPIIVARDPRSTHPMVTRHVAGVTKHVDHPQLFTVATPPTLSPIPTSVRSMLADPHWCHAMEEEYETLLSNST